MALKRIETVHGPMLAFAGDVYITRCLEETGAYGPAEWAALARMVQSGMTVVEVGANIGVHAVPLARACAPGPLYAFEPQQRVFQVLCANLALNDIGNALAFPEACGEAEGAAVMPPINYEAHANFGGVSLEAAGERGQPVRVIALDSLELPACGLIKIDAEGYEPQVLKGARETIARCRPLIYTENDRASQQQEVISLLDEMGYSLYWHTPPIAEDPKLFGQRIVSINMFCAPKERGINVTGLELIDPTDWKAPFSAG